MLCPDYSRVSLEARCFHDAYVAGLDFRWRSKDGQWTANGQAVITAVDGGPGRLFRDGTLVQSGDVGGVGHLYAAREGGKHWLFGAEYQAASAKADYNDLGYMQRQNFHNLHAWGVYRTTQKWAGTLETRTQLGYFDKLTLDGLSLARGAYLNTQGRGTNFWAWWIEIGGRPPYFEDREVGDGTTLERMGHFWFAAWIGTDSRKRVYGELDFVAEALFNPGFHFAGTFRLVVRALPQLDFELIPNAEYSTGEPRFADFGAATGAPIFGRLTASAYGAILRATYTFTPKLSLQLYTQLFLAARHYQDFTVGNGRIARVSELRLTLDRPALNPDYEEAAVNVNLVFRWEYRLGSTLFFVYSRAQVPQLILPAGREGRIDFANLGRAPAADVLLLKLTYWWG
jgi:hypothetical protein